MRAGSIGTVEISPTDPLSVLWTRIQELHDYPAETTRLVHMGKVLTLAKDGDAPASNLADVPVKHAYVPNRMRNHEVPTECVHYMTQTLAGG